VSVRTASIVSLICATVVACGSSAASGTTGDEQDQKKSLTPPRDWNAHPAIIEIDDADEIYAVSDIHGHYDAFVELLTANHLIAGSRWTGGKAILVIAGDLIDKGAQSLQVIDLVRALEKSAPASGGRVVTTMGNHEAEFLADPKNDKATSTGEDAIGIDNQLDDPLALARGTDKEGRGKWMSSLPFGVRIKKWFFSHGGNTGKRSMHDLQKKLEQSIDDHGYADDDITGNDSILEAQKWFGDPDHDDAGRDEADALGVEHMVFGHDPGAFGDNDNVAATKNGVLYKIDSAMGIHEGGGPTKVGKAFMLHVYTVGKDRAEVLDGQGDKAGSSSP
jgi:hypothetical protein